MSKTVCPGCQTLLPNDSSFCSNCGLDITKNPSAPVTGATPSYTSGNLVEAITTAGDYLWPKIVVILFAAAPIISVLGVISVSMVSMNNAALYADAGFTVSAGVVIVALILSSIAVITSVIAYKAYKSLLERES